MGKIDNIADGYRYLCQQLGLPPDANRVEKYYRRVLPKPGKGSEAKRQALYGRVFGGDSAGIVPKVGSRR